MIASRDETAHETRDRRLASTIAAASQMLAGLLVAGTWWWLTSPRQGNNHAHFPIFWHTGPFLGASLVLISAGTWALLRRRTVVCLASALAGIAVALAEFPFVLTVFMHRSAQLIVVGFALALAASIALFVSGDLRGADSPWVIPPWRHQ